MANEEQLSILIQGVDFWNEWREKNPGVHVDLRGADLAGLNLPAADLNEADLSGAFLHEANLFEADLRRIDLMGAYLDTMSGSSPEGACPSPVPATKGPR